MVRFLLNYEADPNIGDQINWTPIHSVPLGSQFFGTLDHGPQMLGDVARLLLEHGADLNARTNRGMPLLHVAAAWKSVEVIRVLLEHV
jgi:hypothetical protein